MGALLLGAGCGSTVEQPDAKGTCGDGVCNWWEDANVCPSDCPCGNGVCDPGEDASSCPNDCGAGGGGGSPGRGNPDDFPTTCYATCDEACAQLATCGGESSALYPLTQDDCLTRCTMAEGGGYSPDISGTFKCCTSQADCAAVAQCGGWLKDSDVVASCTRYCDCRLQGYVTELTAGHAPPAGYRFAPDLLMLETSGACVDLSRSPRIHLLGDGKLKLVRIDPAASAADLAELEQDGRPLPTFVDGAGRVSAANGRLVLIVERPETLALALPIAERYGLDAGRELKMRLRDRPAARLYLLEGSDPWQTLDAASELGKMSGLRAELDLVRRYVPLYTPDDPLYPDQWHLHNTGQNGATASVDGRVSEAWDLTLGDPAVIIAINDDGVDLNHPEFAGKLEPALGFPADWETQMGQGLFAQHGTSVTGVAAAKADNTQGGAGVCPGCRILPHLLGPSSGGAFTVSDAEVAQGFTDMVDAGAWVINNSWGYDTGDPVYALGTTTVPPLAAVVQAGFDYAETTGRGGLGTVVLFAAGNSNDFIDPQTAYVTNVAVAAVDDLGLKPYYSSFGPETDIAAPTNGGINGITTTAAGQQYTPDFGGTSSACPFVTGVAGLVLSANPNLTAAEVRDILGSTATKIDPVFGRWDGQGHSDFHGAGLVNAFAAVDLASGGCASPELCIAPSDDCGASCGTLTQCGVCRTQADCAAGYACQALPSLGQLVCVAAKGANPCPSGTHEVNGYCLPLPATCNVCGGTETCNGRDDDCNGVVDDGSVCQGGPMCFIDGPGCGDGMACAGRHCVATCTTAADCATNETCESLKTQYGDVPGPKACMAPQTGGHNCQMRCEVRASTLDDAGLAAFVACMQDGAADCSVIDQCRALFPTG